MLKKEKWTENTRGADPDGVYSGPTLIENTGSDPRKKTDSDPKPSYF